MIPPESISRAVEAQGSWPGIRPIAGIVSTPFMRIDGSICDSPGYDSKSGYFLHSTETFLSVPEHPSQEDARAALALLHDVYCDFPFPDDASREVAVALPLTMLALPALKGDNVPAFLIEANTPGTGKSLLVDVATIIATGTVAPKTTWRDSDELEKRVTAAALAGVNLLAFDNITPDMPFGGTAIDLALTCRGSYQARPLGQSEIHVVPWQVVITGTGNNISVVGDTQRRTLVGRLETRLEHPETRTDFKVADLPKEVRRRRPELVQAALTLLRAYVAAGCPVTVLPLGSFERWSQLVAGAIVWAGGANVITTLGGPLSSDDPKLATLKMLMRCWQKLDPSGLGIGLKHVVETLYPAPEYGTPKPADDELDQLREALENLVPSKGTGQVRVNSLRLGMLLREHRKRNLGGGMFVEAGLKGGSRAWRVVDENGREPLSNRQVGAEKSEVGGPDGPGGHGSTERPMFEQSLQERVEAQLTKPSRSPSPTSSAAADRLPTTKEAVDEALAMLADQQDLPRPSDEVPWEDCGDSDEDAPRVELRPIRDSRGPFSRSGFRRGA